MTLPNVAAGGLLILFVVALLIVARWAWRKHVKREPRSLQQSFDDFARRKRG